MSIDPSPRSRVNEDRIRLFGSADRQIALVCECPDPQCRRTVVLTVAEYERIRPAAVLHPDHRTADA